MARCLKRTARPVLEKARALVRAEPKEPVYTVFDSNGHHVATVTRRRIEGRFYKQRWKDDHLQPVDTIKFDATDYVLLLPYEEIKALEDCRESTDILGLAHVFWDGPHDVEVVDGICGFFGIDDIGELTEQVLEFARDAFNPEPRLERTIEAVVRVPVKFPAGYDTQHLIDHLKVKVEVGPCAEGEVLAGKPEVYHLSYVD